MAMSVDELKIAEILKGSTSLPFLFVGAGMSMRYLSTQNWEGLLRHFASFVDSTPLAYEKFLNKARQHIQASGRESTKNTLNTTIADLIENEFNDNWFTDSRFEESRKNHHEIIRTGVSPFKLEIALHFKKMNLDSIPEKYSKEITLLKRLGKKSIAGIITTNYDLFLDTLYPDYTTYIGQEELIFSQSYAINELYKIHGCSTNPASIIINTQDYQNFEKKNSYLAAKLMTIFVEHPIIFLGYSLDDENVQAIIKAIVDCLSEEKLNMLRDRLIFVDWTPDHLGMSVYPYSRDFGYGKVISMTKVITDSYEELYSLILENKSKYPTKLIRRLKEDMYSLALTSDSPERILVMPMADDDINSSDVEVVVGFGLVELGKQGYRGISPEQVYLDIVFDTQNFNNKLLVYETFPVLLKQVAYSLPVFKYIAEFDYETLPEELERFTTYTFDNNLANNSILKARAKLRLSSIDEAIEKAGLDVKRQIAFIQTLAESNIDIQKLESYLKEVLTANEKILVNSDQYTKTTLKKLIKMLDYLKYKK
ncbi:SIR2 family protein [Paenibacillus macerans]|uniref:SIR2-like domain protein n=1 Tax=Paenibacillus macerans TaxID=44252 RepID=A0A090Y2H8_PAEMA|nr:SIR2 family protein [Paenibacillus macerans]KFM92948.1 SIR2-like domain protein [Paenibacillus macerans]MCY7558535.1 SIR2 family protein [Paenibacillus macerans]MEC0153957.1 SIR2 family protein [Paenibacillus macerans]SUA84771.1 Uncharacterised protein [Paenibacillus macerans]